jgi:predicted N-acetyltransferase YhbS
MTIQPQTQTTTLRDMGDGVVIRRVEERDREGLFAMHSEILAPRAGWDVRAVIDGLWPIGQRDLFLIAEDTNTGQVVSSLGLLQKTVSYGGIPFTVGVPEWVLTRPEYRRKRLIRAQMDIVHEWSEARGDRMQIIGGIPNYYRQFGYDMALDLDSARVGFKAYVPRLKEGEPEPVQVRPATAVDVPTILAAEDHARQRYLVANIHDAAYWEAQIRRAHSDDPYRHAIAIIQTPEGEALGFLRHFMFLNGDHQIVATKMELLPGVSWLLVSLPVVRYLCAQGEAMAARENERNQQEKKKEFGTFNFWLGVDHPIYEVLDDKLPRRLGPYAWYVRIPDLPGFIRHIAPALEDRLARSVVPNHTGDLRLSFYQSGLRLAFERGKLIAVEPWRPSTGTGNNPTEPTDAAFPDLTFYQLLLGYRSLLDLKATRPDIWHEGDGARALLRALFPRQVSELSL